MKRKVLSILALLLMAATGAWADPQEELLVTINASSSFTSGDKTFDDKVTASFSDAVSYDNFDNGWYNNQASTKC